MDMNWAAYQAAACRAGRIGALVEVELECQVRPGRGGNLLFGRPPPQPRSARRPATGLRHMGAAPPAAQPRKDLSGLRAMDAEAAARSVIREPAAQPNLCCSHALRIFLPSPRHSDWTPNAVVRVRLTLSDLAADSTLRFGSGSTAKAAKRPSSAALAKALRSQEPFRPFVASPRRPAPHRQQRAARQISLASKVHAEPR